MRAYAIKKNVNLLDLEKFGFSKILILSDVFGFHFNKTIKNINISIIQGYRVIRFINTKNKWKKVNKFTQKKCIKDLIQAGLVEKVES